MPHYIALIHKEPSSSYGISFPDIPGVVAAADTLDEALSEATEALAFAAEDWQELTGQVFPAPSTLDTLRLHPEFCDAFLDGVVAAIPFDTGERRAA